MQDRFVIINYTTLSSTKRNAGPVIIFYGATRGLSVCERLHKVDINKSVLPISLISHSFLAWLTMISSALKDASIE